MGAINKYTVKIIEMFVEDLDVYIIMEYLETDLKILVTKVDYGEQQLIKIIHSLLCSMHFIHSANIMHRDIKPGNMLISSDFTFKICDFGLSRSIPVDTNSLD